MSNQEKIEQLRRDLWEKLRAAEQAAHALACETDIGPERDRAFVVYERIRTAPRVHL